MQQAASDTIAELVAKETWTAEDHRQLLSGLFEQTDAPSKFRRALGQLETANPQPKGTAALKIGIARYMMCRFQDALAVLADATDNKDRRYFQGMCLKCLNRYDEALAEFERAKAKGWQDAEVDLAIIECLAMGDDCKDAAKALKKLTGEVTQSGDYLYLRGLIAELSGDGAHAVECYQKAIGLEGANPAAMFRLAYYLDLHGQERQAIDLYRQCLTYPPVYANALINLAVLYEDAAEYARAAVCLRSVLACNPNHARAKLFLKDVESSKTMYFDEDQAKWVARCNALLDIPVTDFELSVRARNCLKKMNINTLGDLVRITEPELLGYKNFGETSLKEIKDMLKAKGLRLGQALEEGSALGTVVGILPTKEESEGVLSIPLEQIEMSVRSRKALESLNVATLGDLAKKTEAELLACRNFGQTSLTEIKLRLTEQGLRLREAN